MKLDIKILDSSVKHIKGKEQFILNDNCCKSLEVIKEESFAFQILVKSDKPFFCTLEKSKDIHWRGLNDKIRIDISRNEDFFNLSFLGYVMDDEKNFVGDPILDKKSFYIEEGYQMIWVSGKIPKEFPKDEIDLKVRCYYSNAYEKEQLISTESINVKVLDYNMKPVKEGDFYLDLWQHLCSWARAYDVEYYSEEHFEIIDNYMNELSELGQRVIDLIVSDYPWAGQRCYQFEDNASNLYEFNIVRVYKDKRGSIKCDFSALDRFIDICIRHGIDEEINIFGIIGNWDAYSFGNPLNDHMDPVRVSYYDESKECFDFIRTREELKSYLSILFNHLIEKGLWDRVKIVSDEPNNIELFKESVLLIESAAPNHKVNFKCAIHDQNFFERFGENIQSLSLNTCELINNLEKLPEVKRQVNSRGGRFTWYSCCFPEKLNIFIKSPLIESRLKGWFTYYWDFDGFLRWAYAIWPTNPFNDIRYKYPRWNAGDMFFVYPGKGLKPMKSVRERNFLFGIQDYNLFRDIEKSVVSRQQLMKDMEGLLGKKDEMKFIPERRVKLNFSLNHEEYMKLRTNLIKRYLIK